MPDPTALPQPASTPSDPSALGFADVRPLLRADTLEELGRSGLRVVHGFAPHATSTFGWRFAGWGGPAAWRCGPLDRHPRLVDGWLPPRADPDVGPVIWQSSESSRPAFRLWVPVGTTATLGGFELCQHHAFAPGLVGKLASVGEAVSWSAHRLRDQQRLVEEQRQMQATVAARTAYFAQMSHELRTPVNAILGYVELIREERDELTMDEVCSDLARVHASATHLLSLVNDILELAKAEAGKTGMRREAVEVAAVIAELDDLARPLMAEHGNRWVVECPERAWVWADARRLRQVLANLVSNAAKFTSHGEVRLVVRRFGDDVTFTVADTGIGMSAEKLDRIFAPFEQVHDEARHHGGTGLGLAIAAQFVHQMQGAIDVQSEIGVGSRFVVTLAAAPERAS